MRTLSLALTLTCLLPASLARAERIDLPAPVDRVVIYPQGASVTRSASFAAPPGQHQLVIPDMPPGTDPGSLRIEASGVTLGSVGLQSDRALPDHAPDSPRIAAAKQALRSAEDALRSFDRSQTALATRAEALRQRAQITRDLLRGDSRLPAEQIPDTVERMGALIETLLGEADEQEFRIAMTEPDRQPLTEAIDRARAELDALREEGAGAEALVLTVQAAGDGPASISITGFTDQAGWQPDYDLRLDRAADTLVMQRGLTVWQSSGQDWRDVALTLSTARPQSQSAPTEVYPWMPRVGRPDEGLERARGLAADMAMESDYAAPLVEAAPVVAGEMSRLGVTVIYDYATPVTIRDGADSLRLTLDEKPLTPRIFAEAAPRFDSSAFLVAETVNSTGEPILPGPVTLYADGALVGRSDVELVADGDKLRFGFGAIDGLRAEIRLPEETEGDSGIIRRSSTLSETAMLIVENLTGEDWPLRVVDRVPVSRQEELKIDWSADPEPSQTDPDGRRGVLVWEDPIAAGELREISLTTELRWPDGNELLR
ncbi:MAG: mucoidy inhibitor MuiA family protein [Paracoccus sp. (in: a-proteobacteria)]